MKTGRSWGRALVKRRWGRGWLAAQPSTRDQEEPAGEQPGVFQPPAGLREVRPCPRKSSLPVGVKPVERIRAMAGGQLAAEVADVQAAGFLAGAGAHPTRGS